jgi:tRNA uridine 5-carboxymethylaminomethyl modification enzyme
LSGFDGNGTVFSRTETFFTTMWSMSRRLDLPADTQEAFLHTIEGLENVRILRYGYGIEYDAFPPEQMCPTLECRSVPGLYLAGQLKGTTGYEEAAGLGLLAGANAAFKLLDRVRSFPRDESYLVVMWTIC